MGKYLLIGGGDIGRGNTKYETGMIDEEAVKMTGISHPNMLFIGLASSYSDSYYDTVKKIYADLGCTCSYLKKKNILNNPDIVKEKIASADIIYIGGGDTVKLVDDIKNYGIDCLLIAASRENKVFVGMSAGAISLAKEGLSDALILKGESDSYTLVQGLGLVDLSISPHYHKDSKRREWLSQELKDSQVFYGIDDGVAIKFSDGQLEVIGDCLGGVYRTYHKEGKFYEEKVK